ncbi:MAG: transglycosylase domain-containing protein [Ruminococcus sp.]|nr:transglycosylase domain-containing protein [Ruminococcus sp.]
MEIVKRVVKILGIVLLIVVVIALYYVAKGYDMYKEAINNMAIEDKIKEIKSINNYTTVKELPSIYIDAVISVEDHRFYKHKGIDIIAIFRALFHDLKAGSFIEGGSTITQQLAKNTYFTQEKKIERKIAEVFMAFEFEKRLEKNEILELYINSSYYGNGYYTVKDASEGYFSKEPIDMSDYEAIMLAGIPNAPSVYAINKNPQLAKERQQQVIKQMVKFNFLTQEEADKIKE